MGDYGICVTIRLPLSVSALAYSSPEKMQLNK